MEENFKLRLEINGIEYKAEGETMLSALEKLPLDWQQIKTKGIIYFEKEKNSGSKLMYMKPLRMLFVNKTRRAGWARQFETLLEANANK